MNVSCLVNLFKKVINTVHLLNNRNSVLNFSPKRIVEKVLNKIINLCLVSN